MALTATGGHLGDRRRQSVIDRFNWQALVALQQKLESSRSPQVPPPRQSYSPGGVTIFALPAVPLCPL